MEDLSVIKEYEWDLAISLCQKDVGFARKLVKAVNPSLKVFFYEDRQAELIGKSGPEAFARIFKEKSRVVVILSRNEWSNSYYTDIERNAIIDRTAVRNQGYRFLMVIPMVQDEIPSWYPSTQIYASSFKFSIEELARFIEFKVTEEGGVVKPLTVEDRYKNFLDRIEMKKANINLQNKDAAVQCAKDEILVLKNCFNSKIDYLRSKIVDNVQYYHFNFTQGHAHFQYGRFLLDCNFSLEYDYQYSILTTQDVIVTFKLIEISSSNQGMKILEEEQRVFYFTPDLKGWASPHLLEHPTNSERQVLFCSRDNLQFYDLVDIKQTEALIDGWFQRLLISSTESISRFL